MTPPLGWLRATISGVLILWDKWGHKDFDCDKTTREDTVRSFWTLGAQHLGGGGCVLFTFIAPERLRKLESNVRVLKLGEIWDIFCVTPPSSTGETESQGEETLSPQDLFGQNARLEPDSLTHRSHPSKTSINTETSQFVWDSSGLWLLSWLSYQWSPASLSSVSLAEKL